MATKAKVCTLGGCSFLIFHTPHPIVTPAHSRTCDTNFRVSTPQYKTMSLCLNISHNRKITTEMDFSYQNYMKKWGHLTLCSFLFKSYVLYENPRWPTNTTANEHGTPFGNRRNPHHQVIITRIQSI